MMFKAGKVGIFLLALLVMTVALNFIYRHDMNTTVQRLASDSRVIWHWKVEGACCLDFTQRSGPGTEAGMPPAPVPKNFPGRRHKPLQAAASCLRT